MQRFQIPNSVRPLIDDLREIGRHGIPAIDDLSGTHLVELLSGPREQSSQQTTRRLIRLIEETIATELQGKEKATAQIYFGCGEFSGIAQRDRYLRIAQLHDRKRWDEYRKEPLTRHLYAVYLALVRLSGRTGVAGLEKDSFARSTNGDDDVESNSGYRLRKRKVTYNFPQREGDPREILDSRKIEALVDGVEIWSQNKAYWVAERSGCRNSRCSELVN